MKGHEYPRTVADLLLRSADTWPDNVAVAIPDGQWTYAQLLSRAREVALGLAAIGVAPGDKVGLLLPNGPDFVVSWFGVSLAGAVIVPINIRYKSPELAYAVSHAELSAVITTDSVADYVDFPRLLCQAFPELEQRSAPDRLTLAEAPRLCGVVNLGDGNAPWLHDRTEFMEKAGSHPAGELESRRKTVQPHSLAALVFTSGTTSRPKACMHTHQGLLHNWFGASDHLKLAATDVVWNPLPLFHGQGYGMMLAAISAGAAFLTQSHFDAATALRLIRDHGATILYPGFPAVTAELIEHERFPSAGIPTVRAVLAIGSRDLWDRSQAAFAPAVQFSAYGLQEVGGAIAFGDLADDAGVRRDTCGQPFPGVEVRIVDRDSKENMPPGATGEILVRGPGQFDGYYRDPGATRKMVDDTGFVHTGDLGSLDDAGRIIFKDRAKNMLKVGGENVAPSEIETVLLSHPSVARAAVVGIPDERLDQVPAAFVELHDPAAVSPEEIIEYCAERLARFKVPRLIRFVTEWPMSATKIKTPELRDRLLAELAETQHGHRTAETM